MSTVLATEELLLEPADNRVLANLCGQRDEHLRQIEQRLGVQISNRGNHFRIMGPVQTARMAAGLLRELFALAGNEHLDPQRLHVFLQDAAVDERVEAANGVPAAAVDGEVLRTRRSHIRPRGPNQRAYIASIRENDLCFGIGPAGTGKTYLAVASAVEALEQERVRRIVLVRPAVEAGERLGFLPGDLAQKVDPYLRPMYDALYEMLGFDRVARLVERNVIEVAPLAYMRGRSLNESFIILDEAQNTSVEQMKMFLTRMGFGSRAVVTGDVTQVDLPRRQLSGLRHVMQVLQGVPGVSFTFFSPRDVVRHALVQRIVEAYEAAEQAGADPGNGSDDAQSGPPAA
ncbi:MAG: PhoH family protein [Gammaproteobacteria bacterium]|nr:PhoH family protein [Gammaproteobacteria bacterium]